MEKGYQLQQWVFVESIGGGGMAEVWKARHTHLDEFAAIKFLLPSFSGDSEVQARFLREGRSQFILRHPNIVRSSDFITQDNRHFLVMDYIEGRSLYMLAMDEGPLDAAHVVRLALPLLDALAYAHDKGIVHRDVKLQNILLGENDKPYLTDFGIAKALRSTGGTSLGPPLARFLARWNA
jgi:serine/threonine-protein kinase